MNTKTADRKREYISVPLPFPEPVAVILANHHKQKLRDVNILELEEDGTVELNNISIIRMWYLFTGVELTDKESEIALILLEQESECIDTRIREIMREQLGISAYNLGNVLYRLRKKYFITDNNCIHPVIRLLKHKHISRIVINNI